MVGIYEGAIDALCHRRLADAVAEDRQLDGDDPALRAAGPATSTRATTSTSSRREASTPATHSSPTTPAGSDGHASARAASTSAFTRPGWAQFRRRRSERSRRFCRLRPTLDEDERDPWWTLMVFFNSLRELGTSLSLLQSDIPDYLWALRNRLGLPLRRHGGFATSSSSRAGCATTRCPKAMEQLEVETTSGRRTPGRRLPRLEHHRGRHRHRPPLADVPSSASRRRPRSTSRSPAASAGSGGSGPALVATIYSASKPRDRSHFEKFRTLSRAALRAGRADERHAVLAPPVARTRVACGDRGVRAAGRKPARGRQSVPVSGGRRRHNYRGSLQDRVAYVDPEEQDTVRCCGREAARRVEALAAHRLA